MDVATSATLIDKIAEFGPVWLFVAALLVMVGYGGKKIIEIYEATRKEKLANDRDMIKISSQMVEQMERSNNVIEAVEKQMTIMNGTNAQLVNQLLRSDSRNEKMSKDMRTIRDRIDLLYERLIKGEL